MFSFARYGTRDLDKARAFYDALGEVIGAKRVMDGPNLSAYSGPAGTLFVIGTPFEGEQSAGNGVQVSFRAGSPEEVDAIYAKAIACGATCAGAPGSRGTPEFGLYAAYFRDLDGNKLAALHLPNM